MEKPLRFILLGWLWAVLAQPLVTQALTDLEAVNMSGSQRMLTQRMMKDYLMIGADVKPDLARIELSETTNLFEANLDTLADYSDSPDINQGLEQVHLIWQQHKPQILATPDKSRASALIDENLTLLKACQQLVERIEAQSLQHNADIVNLSGRQRMLSQRIAKVYMAMFWEVPNSELQAEFDTAQSEFASALATLQSYPDNTPAITQELGRVAVHWKFAQPGMDLSPDKPHAPGNIFITMNSVMDKMDTITHLYETALNNKAR